MSAAGTLFAFVFVGFAWAYAGRGLVRWFKGAK